MAYSTQWSSLQTVDADRLNLPPIHLSGIKARNSRRTDGVAFPRVRTILMTVSVVWRKNINVQDRERGESLASETAVLVRVILPNQRFEDDPLEELEGLATTAGTHVVCGLTQRRESADATTFIGKGKVEELAKLVETHHADVVIFDNDLSPGQTRNLEKAIGVKVIDRTELILDIFATHAQTYEARLAVELAQLEYSLPRLKRLWTHLSRMKLGVGMRGPGEKQLEEDRRLVEKRIHDLREELHEIELRKERQVAARDAHMTVSLVGYTNAGKSTLMNALTGAGVLVEDKLFATLDTRTRRWQLPNWGPVLLSDTVGFIRQLPHRLIASFKATLEEARQADLLLHVADVSNPAVYDQISAVYDVLREIGIEEKDLLLVLNKIDHANGTQQLEGVRKRYPNAIPMSALTGEGRDRLAIAVSDALSRSFADVDVRTSVTNGRLMAFLARHGEILSRHYQNEDVILHCRLPRKFLGRIGSEEACISPRESEGHDAVPGTSATDAVEDVA
jgi:GTP-binding protein HflX